MMPKKLHGVKPCLLKKVARQEPQEGPLLSGRQTCFSKFSGRNMVKWLGVVFMAVAVFSFTACGDSGDPTNPGDDPNSTVFTSIDKLTAYLAAQSVNTAATPYTISLNIKDLPSISNSAFSNKYINLDLSGSTFTSIGDEAFRDCTNLTGVTIGNSVTSIGDEAFAICTRLASVTIGNSVISIGNSAFFGCTRLVSVTIPNSVTSIGYYAFMGCTGLTNITIPNSVTSIGGSAFHGCSGLTSIMVESGNTVFRSEGNCVIRIADNTLILGCKNSIIPNSVTSIGDAFYDSKDLTSVTIPNSVTSIGDYAFNGCASLASVTIPSSVTSIGNGAFSRCTSLTSVTFVGTIRGVGANVFPGDLRDKFYATNSSNGTPGTYTRPSGGNTWTRVSGGDEPGTGPTQPTYTQGLEFTLNSGNVYSVSQGTARDAVIIIPATYNGRPVTAIAYNGFYNFMEMTSVTIPSSVTSIGVLAFMGCDGLTRLTIPNSVTDIGKEAFIYCTGLTSVTIGNSVRSLGEGAFKYCSNLTSVTFLGSTITSFGDEAFLRQPSYTDNRLRLAYNSGGAGTYTRDAIGIVWTKQ